MFVLIDLETQAEAVAKYVQGWTKQQFLAWISQFGRLEENIWKETISVGDILVEPNNDVRYFFCSFCGLYSTFEITENNELILKLFRRGKRDIKVQLSEED